MATFWGNEGKDFEIDFSLGGRGGEHSSAHNINCIIDEWISVWQIDKERINKYIKLLKRSAKLETFLEFF